MGWITRTVQRFVSLPSNQTEYRTDQFTFPAILNGITKTVHNVGRGNVSTDGETSEWLTGINTIVTIQPDLRPAISLPTVHKIVTSFHSSEQSADAIYSINTNVIRLSGRLMDFNFGEVLNNAITELTASAGTYDNSLYGLTETASFGASSPTASAYTAAIGTEKLISSNVQRYRGNIWIKRNIYITLK